jgi:acetyl/propionyl-CoA carboxylase alpha subunit
MNEKATKLEGEIVGETQGEVEGELHETFKGGKVKKQLSAEELEEKRKKVREAKNAKRKAMSPEARMEKNMQRQQRRKRLSADDLETVRAKERERTSRKRKREAKQHTFVQNKMENEDGNKKKIHQIDVDPKLQPSMSENNCEIAVEDRIEDMTFLSEIEEFIAILENVEETGGASSSSRSYGGVVDCRVSGTLSIMGTV